MATRAQLRTRLSRAIRDYYTGAATASAGVASLASTTLIDTVRRTESDDYWNNREFIITAGALSGSPTYRVTDYSSGSMTFSPSTASALTTVNATAYEIHRRVTFDEYHEAINSGIRRASNKLRTASISTAITASSNTQDYTIPASVVLGRVSRVYYKNSASEVVGLDNMYWDVMDYGSGTKLLHFYDGKLVAEDLSIYMEYEAPLTELTSDTSTIPDDYAEYIQAYGLYYLHEMLSYRSDIDVEEHLRRSYMHLQHADQLLADLHPANLPGKLTKGTELFEGYASTYPTNAVVD